MTRRGSGIGTLQRIQAVLTSPMLYELGADLTLDTDVGRPAVHPPYVMLAYGALARIARSSVRVEEDLAQPTTWQHVRQLMVDSPTRRDLGLPPPGAKPPTWDHWRYYRDSRLTTDEGLADMARAFPVRAHAVAQRLGLLDPHGPGSLTHPHPSRAVYGDGTSVRPLYRPPEPVIVTDADGRSRRRYRDPTTGQLSENPTRRYDHDLRAWHGGAPWQLGHAYVAHHTRGPRPHQRVVLAIAHVPAPGQEAATAVELLRDVHRVAGDGVQVIVYDGAFTGAHIDTIMTRHGYLVIAKMPTGDSTEDTAGTTLVRTSTGRRARSYPLGTVTHTTLTGTCSHLLAAVAGQVTVIDLDDQGDPVAVATATRGAIKRSRRTTGAYHLNVGYSVPCPLGSFTTWLSPHAGRDADLRRPHNLRVIAEGDPDWIILRGLRSDAENYHSNFKRTLMVNRAMSLGWRRGLVENTSFCLLNNALAEYRARTAADTAPAVASRRLRALRT